MHGDAKEFPQQLVNLAAGIAELVSLQTDSLRALKDLNPRNTGDEVDTDTTGIRNYGQAHVDLSTAITDKVETITPPSYRITVMDIPPNLQKLTIKLNDPDAQPFNILANGNVVKLDVPIQKVYVTSSPAAPGSTLKILAGNAEIGPRLTIGAAALAIRDMPFLVKGGEQTSVDVSTMGADGPEMATIQDVLSAAASKDSITKIPPNTLFRIKSRFTFLLNSSAGSETTYTYKLKKGATEFQQMKYGGMENEGAWEDDTGWIMHANDPDVTWAPEIIALGPAGQIMRFSARIWLIPNE